MANSRIYLGPLLEEATTAIVTNLSNSLGGTINLMSSALQGVTNAMSDRLAELLGGVKTATDNMKTATDNMKTAMDGVKTSVTTINTTLGTTNGKIDTSNTRLNTLDSTLKNYVAAKVFIPDGSNSSPLSNVIDESMQINNAGIKDFVSAFSVNTYSGVITLAIKMKTSSASYKQDVYLKDIATGAYIPASKGVSMSTTAAVVNITAPVVAGHSYSISMKSQSGSPTIYLYADGAAAKYGFQSAASSTSVIS